MNQSPLVPRLLTYVYDVRSIPPPPLRPKPTSPNRQVLNLNDNYISRIEGLDGLVKLRDLQLARNDIATLPHSLLQHTALTSLNLADNRLASFKPLRLLARLPQLTDLCLSDPMWGDSPVSQLCNYQVCVTSLTHLMFIPLVYIQLSVSTSIALFVPMSSIRVCQCTAQSRWRLTDTPFVPHAVPTAHCPPTANATQRNHTHTHHQTYMLYLLPRLTSLDTLLLADEAKALSEATYLKKQMYYNMRIKTLRRSASAAIRLARQGLAARLAGLWALHGRLVRLQQEMRRELDEAADYDRPLMDEDLRRYVYIHTYIHHLPCYLYFLHVLYSY